MEHPGGNPDPLRVHPSIIFKRQCGDHGTNVVAEANRRAATEHSTPTVARAIIGQVLSQFEAEPVI